MSKRSRPASPLSGGNMLHQDSGSRALSLCGEVVAEFATIKRLKIEIGIVNV
jgi:hypothetical protein